MLPIVWSSRALDDLNGIAAFIAARDGQAALRLQDRIEQSVEPAALNPYMFRSGRVDGTREIIAHPNYIVVYRVLAEMILVTAVIHSRQKYP